MTGRLERGLVQVYTGDGKGKTSAAFGLALRAIGRGLKVFIVQFIKGGFDYGELYSVKGLKNLELKAFGRGKFVLEFPDRSLKARLPVRRRGERDVELAKEALELAAQKVKGGSYDIVILDEINVALHLELIELGEVVELIRSKPKHVELVLTGRDAPPQIIEMADLVTEMREIKHPFRKGVAPREGIEF